MVLTTSSLPNNWRSHISLYFLLYFFHICLILVAINYFGQPKIKLHFMFLKVFFIRNDYDYRRTTYWSGNFINISYLMEKGNSEWNSQVFQTFWIILKKNSQALIKPHERWEKKSHRKVPNLFVLLKPVSTF